MYFKNINEIYIIYLMYYIYLVYKVRGKVNTERAQLL